MSYRDFFDHGCQCRLCGVWVPWQRGGRRPVYCSPACRQRAYRERSLAVRNTTEHYLRRRSSR